jgi:hypothetical protein
LLEPIEPLNALKIRLKTPQFLVDNAQETCCEIRDKKKREGEGRGGEELSGKSEMIIP